jgi:hypothetical protein
MLSVKTAGYRVVRGKEHIRSFAAPLLHGPPAYKTWFCTICGSPVADPEPKGDFVEIPAGTLDDATGVKPDKHIYVELKADWDCITDGVRQFTRDEIRAFRDKYGWVSADREPATGG